MKKILISIILILISLISGFFYGRSITKESLNTETEINSEIILDTLKEQYFMVTKTLFLNEKLNIKFDKGSSWSNFLWGQTLKADAIIRLDIGVDLSNIKNTDIKINRDSKIIEIKLPHASILDSSIYGDISIDTKEGILKKIFEDNTNEDYNKAIKTLTENAKNKVSENKKVFQEAEISSVQIIKLILQNFGYEVRISGEKN